MDWGNRRLQILEQAVVMAAHGASKLCAEQNGLHLIGPTSLSCLKVSDTLENVR
jgi:hypothetical protein